MESLSLLPSPIARMILRLIVATAGRYVDVERAAELTRLPDPAIFAFNHNNSYESLIVPSVLMSHRQGKPIHFLVDWMYLQIPALGWLIRQIDPIPVYTKPARWKLRNKHRQERYLQSPIPACLDRLLAGQSVGIFPEGKRNPDLTRLLPGQRGVGTLVLSSDVPVVPVGIDFPARHRLGRMPRLGKIRVTVGAPLYFLEERNIFRELRQKPVTQVRSPNRQLAQQVSHRVMEAISNLCTKDYPHSTSVLSRDLQLNLKELS